MLMYFFLNTSNDDDSSGESFTLAVTNSREIHLWIFFLNRRWKIVKKLPFFLASFRLLTRIPKTWLDQTNHLDGCKVVCSWLYFCATINVIAFVQFMCKVADYIVDATMAWFI